jgi:hypothetical protein
VRIPFQLSQLPFSRSSHLLVLFSSYDLISKEFPSINTFNMPAFEDSDFGVEPQRPQTPILSHLQKIVSNGSPSKYSHNLSVPSERQTGTNGTIEIPATRSSIAESQALMHSLSMSPSQVDRRGSRNSFGASLPIPRSKRQSRLSSVTAADGRPTQTWHAVNSTDS